MNLRIRPATADDMAFVVDTWRRSFEGSPAVAGASKEHYFDEMRRVVGRYAASAELRIACDPNDANHLVGYACFTGPELHWAYIKRDFRGLGIMHELLEGAEIDSYTFRPSRRPPSAWRFTPRFTLP